MKKLINEILFYFRTQYLLNLYFWYNSLTNTSISISNHFNFVCQSCLRNVDIPYPVITTINVNALNIFTHPIMYLFIQNSIHDIHITITWQPRCLWIKRSLSWRRPYRGTRYGKALSTAFHYPISTFQRRPPPGTVRSATLKSVQCISIILFSPRV